MSLDHCGSEKEDHKRNKTVLAVMEVQHYLFKGYADKNGINVQNRIATNKSLKHAHLGHQEILYEYF